jgi:Raf kinase inhibitor-like YbhB/YbcL family protein
MPRARLVSPRVPSACLERMGAYLRRVGFRGGTRLAILWVVLLFACSGENGHAVAARQPPGMDVALRVSSGAFGEGGDIPSVHTCDGADRSVPLRFAGAPERTSSFALIVDDPDAPRGTWVHWIVWNLPASTEDLPEGVPTDAELPDGSRQGRNDFGRTGWGGPCPPRGPAHRYFFRLYALDAPLDPGAGATRADLDRAMQGHVLQRAQLMGRYQRR